MKSFLLQPAFYSRENGNKTKLCSAFHPVLSLPLFSHSGFPSLGFSKVYAEDVEGCGLSAHIQHV